MLVSLGEDGLGRLELVSHILTITVFYRLILQDHIVHVKGSAIDGPIPA
jgi:hypothetical protein